MLELLLMIIAQIGTIAVVWLKLHYQGRAIRKIEHQTNAMHDALVHDSRIAGRREGAQEERARAEAREDVGNE